MAMDNKNAGEVREEIKIVSGVKLLTAKELIEKRNVDIGHIKSGLKKVNPDGSVEERNELEKLRTLLRQQISCPRIDRIASRTIAEWDEKRKTIKVLKIEGKFQNFGYTKNKEVYLHRFEALFLLELNRLELYFNSILVSVEQAYHLLLGSNRNKDYDKYLIYTTFSRAGYVVKKFDNCNYTPNNPTEIDCIWEIFLCSINSNYEIPPNIRNLSYFESMKKSMNQIKKIIRNQEKNTIDDKDSQEASTSKSETTQINFKRKMIIQNSGKRKLCKNATISDGSNKRQKICQSETNQFSSTFLNNEIDESNDGKFENIFKNLETTIMKIENSKDDPNIENARDLEIVFDVFATSENFINNHPPNLRVIISGPSEELPNRSELYKVYHKQIYKIPLIVVSIGVSKQIQAFMYYFT